MKKKINWIHFSDLHYGQKSQNILLPKIKNELFKDIELLKNEIGKIDIVFFTGDLTQSGKKEEFDQLNVFLNELWDHFDKLKSNPMLIAIPGNHDLERPDVTRAVAKVLRNYSNDVEFQDLFWSGDKSQIEYYELISQCFSNFSKWYTDLSLPKPTFINGMIPGDVSTALLINGISLNVLGLNTAFLELNDDDYFGKLAVNPNQLLKLTGTDPLKWAQSADISLLLTHHDPTWYDKKSIEYYNNDINPSSTYFSHLCGHLHEPNSYEYGLTDWKQRRVQLAPSLFGLQTVNNKLNRIHGYYAGSYILSGNNIVEHFYPRITQKKYDGNYTINPDFGFNLNTKNFCETIYARNNVVAIPNSNVPIQNDKTPFPQSDNSQNSTSKNILDLEDDEKVGFKELEQIPKVSYAPLTQHTNIRLVEQKDFLRLIKKDRLVWLVTDWGLNEGGFIGSISDQLNLENPKNNVILNCEDIVNDQELIDAFNSQFGMTLQNFCNIISKLNNNLIILNHININLFATNNLYQRFLNIITSIIDYCPQTYIILIARQAPSYISTNDYVKLYPLDALQVQSYIENHPNAEAELTKPENLLKIIEVTSGLPKHIDRIIESSKVASFDELMEAESETPNDLLDTKLIPKSLIQVINTISDTTDKAKLRSFKLLKILTVLSNGETISNLRRFDSNDPIYIDNANELEQLSLLEVISTNFVLTQVSGNLTYQIKLLRIPRQIRDYVNSIITESERDTILKQACDMYFGHKWREGSIKNIKNSSLFKDNKFLNIDNCHLIIRNLLTQAFKTNNELEIERFALLSCNYCTHVYDIKDFKNSLLAAEEIYNLLKFSHLNRLKTVITKLYGESLRMLDHKEKSIAFLNEALEFESDVLSNDEKNEIYIELGFTYILQSKFDKAIECSKAIEKTCSSKGAHKLQAKYIFVQASYIGDERIRRLKTIESECKRQDIPSLANTISLKIVSLINDDREKETRLVKVLECKTDDYNKIRAIISKSLQTTEKGSGVISNDDLHLLSITYSYLYNQRLQNLFTECHKALWLHCMNKKQYQDLLNLYKHSSLVWRISGEKELEKTYFDKLDRIDLFNANLIPHNGVNDVNVVYFKRRKLEFESLEHSQTQFLIG